jgi:ribosome-binding factor A
MESKRQLQVGELIRRNMSVVLQAEGPYIFDQEALVTVTNVRMSPDLSLAKIYLSVYNVDDKNSIIMMCDQHHHGLKQSLVHRIRKHVRRIPNIEFYLDDTLDEMERIDSLFDKLKKK